MLGVLITLWLGAEWRTRNDVVVTVQGREQELSRHRLSGKAPFTALPLVVLVNQNSATAVAAGPLQTIGINPLSTIATGSPWYKTWWGIGLIGVAAFLGYKRFVQK